jgi:hypothetical protein
MNRFFLLMMTGILTLTAFRLGECSPQKKKGDEFHLQALSQRIDATTSSMNREDHIDRLAEGFSVPLSVIDEKRQRGLRWGDITIELSIAQALFQRDPVHYATVADALFELDRQKVQSHHWRALARSLHVSLHDVLIMTAQSYNSLRSAGTIERTGL